MSGDLSDVKVGDTLFVSSRWNKSLVQVQRVTPTGRVIIKSGAAFKPDGYMMGQTGWDRTTARLATADDIAGINRSHLVDKCRHFSWDKLDAESLKAVGEIVAAHVAKHGERP